MWKACDVNTYIYTHNRNMEQHLHELKIFFVSGCGGMLDSRGPIISTVGTALSGEILSALHFLFTVNAFSFKKLVVFFSKNIDGA